MSEDETKQSRRARRRAEREAEEREAEEAEVEAGGADDGEGDEGEEPGEAEPAPRAPSRAERRAAKKAKAKSETASTDDIRDRNQRLRDKAAARRREKREREAAVARGLDAGEMVDDALARATHGATSFVRKHFNIVQWVLVLGIAGGIGYQIWSWRHGKSVAKASDVLYAAVEAERGRVGAAEEAPKADPLTGVVDPTPVFATDEARLGEAAKKYQEAAELRKGSGTAILAKLGLAGVHFDQGKFDEAIAAYEEVKGSELAKHDADVRLRATEGIGLAREAKGDLDGALKVFKELENADVVGFKGLGFLHQARVLYAKGDKTKAKELAKAAQEQTNTERSPYQTAGYLDSAARELLAAIDPSTIPPTPAAAGYSPEQMDALREQILKDPTKLQKMLQDMGKSVPKIPEMPAPPPIELPAPAPPGSGAP